MAAAGESTDDALWNASVCRKSWADLVEEEEEQNKEHLTRSLRSRRNNSLGRKILADVDEEDSSCDGGKLRGDSAVRSNFKTPVSKGNHHIYEEEANLGKSENGFNIPKVESLPNFGKSVSGPLSKTPVKNNPQLPQDDISLTGHLDVKLGLSSPAKEIARSSPLKRKAKQGASQDEMLMPSPSKILRSTPKKEAQLASPAAQLLTRKRVRENLTPSSSSKNTPRRSKREAETDPEVLGRRQKQIDFGKNTLGYERYCQLVPKEKREKIHPKTPPLGIKFSRRAWDGLVRVWRQRLHFWDPPSEGGGNPACLDIPSDASDYYSTDSSLPNTPVQEVKRKRAERSTRYSTRHSETSEREDDIGCTPLPN